MDVERARWGKKLVKKKEVEERTRTVNRMSSILLLLLLHPEPSSTR